MGKDSTSGSKTPGRVTAFLDRLSTSNLVFLVAAVFLVDLFVPDMLPVVDEVVLGVLTVLLARWRTDATRRAAEAEDAGNETGDGTKPPPKNVTPPG